MLHMTAQDIAAAVTAGSLDPVEVTDAFLGRIIARNPDLNALVGFDPALARKAAIAVRSRVASGEPMALAGVPVVVKDNIWVAGRNITQGSRLFADFKAPEDAIAVARLRQAGAVVIGIGNCPEFVCKGVTNSPHNGIARHPLNPRLTPGGSSGGNAAALAADFAPIALGTDGGGSGRRPSAHTGTVGFKPSFGAIPYGPGFPEPYWGIAVIAPMARTVGDVRLLFDTVAGADPRDPESIEVAPASAAEPHRLRFAYSPRLGLDVAVDADVDAAIEAALALIEAAGGTIDRADPMWPPGLNDASLVPLQAAGLAALHGEAWRRDPSQFDADVAEMIAWGVTLSGTAVADVLETSARIKRAVAELFVSHDVLVCPTAPCVAWPSSELGPSRIGGRAVTPRAHAIFTPFFNHALVPAISIPCGRGRAGLPVGLQLIARHGEDRRLLATAAAIETVLEPLNRYCRS